jgi:hypothetical protein
VLGYFFESDDGGRVIRNGGTLHGAEKSALPGGDLEGQDPIDGALREFYEETGDWIISGPDEQGFALEPVMFEGSTDQGDGKYYGVYFDVGHALNNVLNRVNENLRAGASAAVAVQNGRITDYSDLAVRFPNCPPDNELAYLKPNTNLPATRIWNLQRDWPTIQGWQSDRDLSWFYYILNNLSIAVRPAAATSSV